ncbi:MAG: hypothetical protein COB66_09315 [Coxiella sp. (in: Bacteria)]|nr:MAG: hypothetical protein COB66_09315 [Coxiella sp. (in: g-proteobacteria)]
MNNRFSSADMTNIPQALSETARMLSRVYGTATAVVGDAFNLTQQQEVTQNSGAEYSPAQLGG